LSDLTLKLRNQVLQVGDYGVLLGHHRLFVLTWIERLTDASNCAAAKAFIISGGKFGNWL